MSSSLSTRRGGIFATYLTFFKVKCLVMREIGVLIRAKVDLEILRENMRIVSLLIYCEWTVGLEIVRTRANLDRNCKTR